MGLSSATQGAIINMGLQLFKMAAATPASKDPEIERLEKQKAVVEALLANGGGRPQLLQPPHDSGTTSVEPRAASISVSSASLKAPTPSLPSTQETIAELRRRLGKELYRIELDLQGGARIAGKPCDCLTRGKHLGGVEATAEELMSYENNPVYGQVVSWLNKHAPEFEPAQIAQHDPGYYQGLTPQVRAFRKQVMGTEALTPLLTEQERKLVKQRVAQKLEGIDATAHRPG